MGKGWGRHVLAAAMAYGFKQYHPRFFRATVARFNGRAKIVCGRLGYRTSSTFVRASDGRPFEILTQPARMPALSIPLVEE
jgi:hypothetical protein